MDSFLAIAICLYLMTRSVSLLLRTGDREEPWVVKVFIIATLVIAALAIIRLILLSN